MNNNFWYRIIKQYYGLGLYASNDLDLFVATKYITEEQKEEIVAVFSSGASTSTTNNVTDSSTNISSVSATTTN